MTASPDRAVKLFGTNEPPAETRILTAGPLTVELDAGNLRYIRYQGVEAIRAIAYVVRDRYWGTYAPTIADFEVTETEAGFTVGYTATCREGDSAYTYSVRIRGETDGTLHFEADGSASRDFLTNRTGFVVLHAIEGVAGRPVVVEDVDGGRTDTVFPDLIDPKQPIMDIRALTHEVIPGVQAECTMRGDAFEMEDQRNWTDASYKTYVRPLGLPHPYTLAAGETVSQSVSLRFIGSAAAVPAGAAASTPVSVALGATDGAMPVFGMALEAPHAETARQLADRLAALSPGFLSCHFDVRQGDPTAAMRAFRAVAEQLSVPTALEAVLSETETAHDELAVIARSANAAGLVFETVAVTPAGDLGFVAPGTVFPDDSEFRALYGAARTTFPDARIGGGTFVYFTELNRKPPPADALDFVTHGTSALVHAADDRSVTETLEALPAIFRSVRALYPGLAYRIAPAGIGSRTSPFGNEPTANPDAARVTMTRADPRQRGLLGAAWHLGYAARAAESGVDSVVLGAPVGEFGLIHTAMPYSQPWFDEAGGFYPAFHVMRALYAASGRPRIVTTTSHPGAVQAVAFDGKDGTEIWLANLTGTAQHVALSGIGSPTIRMARIDEHSFETCAGNADGLDATETGLSSGTVELSAYASVRLRTESGPARS